MSHTPAAGARRGVTVDGTNRGSYAPKTAAAPGPAAALTFAPRPPSDADSTFEDRTDILGADDAPLIEATPDADSTCRGADGESCTPSKRCSRHAGEKLNLASEELARARQHGNEARVFQATHEWEQAAVHYARTPLGRAHFTAEVSKSSHGRIASSILERARALDAEQQRMDGIASLASVSVDLGGNDPVTSALAPDPRAPLNPVHAAALVALIAEHEKKIADASRRGSVEWGSERIVEALIESDRTIADPSSDDVDLADAFHRLSALTPPAAPGKDGGIDVAAITRREAHFAQVRRLLRHPGVGPETLTRFGVNGLGHSSELDALCNEAMQRGDFPMQALRSADGRYFEPSAGALRLTQSDVERIEPDTWFAISQASHRSAYAAVFTATNHPNESDQTEALAHLSSMRWDDLDHTEFDLAVRTVCDSNRPWNPAIRHEAARSLVESYPPSQASDRSRKLQNAGVAAFAQLTQRVVTERDAQRAGAEQVAMDSDAPKKRWWS